MDIGATLRDARERRALSVADVAKSTKIKAANLVAIEDNRRDELPEDVYLRGFVRAYAREVGLNADDTARRYLDQFAPPPETIANEADARDSERTRTAFAMAAGEGYRSTRDHWIAAVVLIVIAGVGYDVFQSGSWTSQVVSQISRMAPASILGSQPAAPASATAAAPAPAQARAEVGTTGSVQAPAPADGVLHVTARTSGVCWVTAIADGARVMYRLMQAGEQLKFDVRKETILRIGDPSAFAFSINGAAARPLGAAGEPVTVRITPENYGEFLAR